ncbi:hypothetical protein [Phormidium tenue]|uniref:Phage recombination protein Bet n=1 Tax=Phormidium tenue FACHB-1050 TaxID=2692857 RepID=A0ABR8C8V9_9CYAN|nr:hypothetical protein [Phormidium tenue]MBD2316708.1 hypothetical protein [Phormidium tenue FACHB-1050]
MTNLAKAETQSLVHQDLSDELLAKIVQSGDLSMLSSSDRLIYYFTYCRQLGLNALSKPFDYIEEKDKDGKIKKISLYPNAIAASQLRDSRNVSTRIVEEKIMLDGEIYSVTVEARMGTRTEQATGKVGIKTDNWGKPLNGDSKAKAMKRAETQARRRATLAIVGLDAIGDEDRKASISDIPMDCWTPELSDKLMTIATAPLWDDKLWSIFTTSAEKCSSPDELDGLIKWVGRKPQPSAEQSEKINQILKSLSDRFKNAHPVKSAQADNAATEYKAEINTAIANGEIDF